MTETNQGIREKVKARSKRTVVTETIEGFGEVPILKLDANTVIELSYISEDLQKRTMVAKCVLDEDGEPVFSDAEDAGSGDYEFFKQLLGACYKVNGIKAKIEAAEGN